MLDVHHTLLFLPIHVIPPQVEAEKSIYIGEELESLITTLGGKIVDRVVQRMDKPNMGTFIGRGKVEEVASLVKEYSVDVVVLNAMAKPKQVHTLKMRLHAVNPQIQVWDRVDLILHIFEKHATTTEAKLQIEIARMRYMGPRIYGMGFVLSNQGGGIGTRGIGETNTELMKRHWRDSMKVLTEKLQKMSTSREQQIDKRKRAGLKTVSIVGYTNAGKSSLFNVLSKKNTLAEDALFATLDSTVGKLYLQDIQQEILITDTIGFIRDLPPKLIEAFKSTLLESIHADLLFHVIDTSDPELETKITVVEDILKELGRDPKEVVYIFNKIDTAESVDLSVLKETYAEHHPLFVSVKTGEGIDQIAGMLSKHFGNK